MKFSDIVKEWTDQPPVNFSDTHGEMVRLYNLRQKFMTYEVEYAIRKKELEKELKLKEREIYDRYMGRSENPEPIKIMKSEVNLYVESDKEYLAIQDKISTTVIALRFITENLKHLDSRRYDLNTVLSREKFLAGER